MSDMSIVEKVQQLVDAVVEFEQIISSIPDDENITPALENDLMQGLELMEELVLFSSTVFDSSEKYLLRLNQNMRLLKGYKNVAVE